MSFGKSLCSFFLTYNQLLESTWLTSVVPPDRIPGHHLKVRLVTILRLLLSAQIISSWASRHSLPHQTLPDLLALYLRHSWNQPMHTPGDE